MATLEEAEEKEKSAVHTHRVGFEKVDRAVCEGEPEGFIKVVAGKRDKVLGVHIVGAEAGSAAPSTCIPRSGASTDAWLTPSS